MGVLILVTLLACVKFRAEQRRRRRWRRAVAMKVAYAVRSTRQMLHELFHLPEEC